LRALLAGVVALGAVGSCELPKPKLPSMGLRPGAGVAAVLDTARGTAAVATALGPGGGTR
jgi:hypothetical protein